MFRRVDDFLNSWQYESAATLKMLRRLTDRSLAQRVTSEGRSLGDLAWHVTTSLSEMMSHAGLRVDATRKEQPCPSVASEIATIYERASKLVADEVRTHWRDDSLAGEIPMYGESWTRGATLAALVGHQSHHRGQMTVLMRQAGLVVPGVYGPAKEEWAAMNLPPQK
jgi:uncharacterized damage-inducible protein DinB